MRMKIFYVVASSVACGSAVAVTAFVPSGQLPFLRQNIRPNGVRTRTSQEFQKATLFYKNLTLGEISSETVSTPINTEDPMKERRDDVKKELVRASITSFDAKNKPNYAEDLMKELETMRPWDNTAYHPELNARWSFVFTGVPTVGMKLITLLSRISVGFPIVDFRDVFLDVTDKQSRVKAVVSWKMLGIPFELNVYTSLRPDETHSEGTMMLEHFQGIILNGVPVPTPESWATTRTLEVSYLDEDIMIARTSGGEPHLLLRNSVCNTHDDECDIESELTDFFDEAREKYGPRIARCLVDRDYGDTEANDCSEGRDPTMNILSLDPRSLISPGDKGGHS